MVRRIFKWHIAPGRNAPLLHEHAVIRHVGLDPNGSMCLWAEVNPDNRVLPRQIQVVGTGHDTPEFGAYLGSCIDGSFVWHVFDCGCVKV